MTGRPLVAIPKTKTSKTARKRHHRQAVEFSHDTKMQANVIHGQRCPVGLAGCKGVIHQHHHRQMKSAGGLGGLANCLPVCDHCHTRIHKFVTWATNHGLLVSRYASPDLVEPVFGCGTACGEDHR